jgi:hypothetical protein
MSTIAPQGFDAMVEEYADILVGKFSGMSFGSLADEIPGDWTVHVEVTHDGVRRVVVDAIDFQVQS